MFWALDMDDFTGKVCGLGKYPLLHALSGIEDDGRDFLRSCYFVNWAYGRTSPFTRFDVEHIDPYVCTHLIYAFAKIDPNQARIVPTDPTQDLPSKGKRGRFVTFNELKKTYKHLKTILSVGGEYAQESQFTSVNKDQSTLQTFTQTTVQFLRRWGFDGLDIDWEFPHHGTKATFVRILKALHTAFEANRTNGERLILTAALAAGRHNIDSGYDVKALAKYLDLANLMTYDYHGSWNFATGFDSPLYSRKSTPSINQELSVNWTVHYYISEGIPANKILVGVTAAGTRYKLTDTSKTGVGAPSVNNWRPESRLWKLHARYAYPEVGAQLMKRQPGLGFFCFCFFFVFFFSFLGCSCFCFCLVLLYLGTRVLFSFSFFSFICQILQRTDTKHVFDKEQQVPYLYFSNEWCGYDDVQSVKIKREWMLKVGVAGAMFWAMDMDDFTGRMCALGKYPLLRALSGIEDNRQGGGAPCIVKSQLLRVSAGATGLELE
ncbi:chitinase-3-like protein 2 [Babylonia areolata]|uniref:chitinase-3-like protein 2 n=1 Tax=Babylonia areolata TaxID=304850 RepID=UPI003FD4EACD